MRIKKVLIFLSLAFTSSLLLSTGCGMMEKVFIDDLMPKRVSKNNKQVSKKENGAIESKKGTDSKGEAKSNQGTPANPTNEQKEKINVIIFLADQEANKLVPVKRQIYKVEGLAKAALNELIKGPNQELKVLPVIPKGTKILGIVIKEGICYVNFSRELKDNHPGGSTGENLTVYSIVKTLGQFSTIEQVQILIEGKVIPTLAGHLDISKPLK